MVVSTFQKLLRKNIHSSEDKIRYRETIVKGFEQFPDAFIGLFNGSNKGKMLVEL